MPKERRYIYHLYIDCKMNKKICNHFQKYYKYLIQKEHTPLQQYVFGLPRAKIYLYPLFTTKHKFFTSKNAIFNINTHTHFFTLFNQKTPIKVGIQGENLHIFLWQLKIWILRKIFFRNLKISKVSMPKKWRLNLKQKIKPYFHNTHFLTIF